MDPLYRHCLVQSATHTENRLYLSESDEAKSFGDIAVSECTGSEEYDSMCEYYCMQWVTSVRKSRGLGPLKYYGHWPYLRFFGMQEPASAVFSLLNAVPHFWALHMSIRKQYVRERHYLSVWLSFYPIVSLNAWIASTTYHTSHGHEQQHHVVPLSSSMYDYMSALGILTYAVLLVTRRILGKEASISTVYILSLCTSTFFLVQIYRMYIGVVTYNSHMQLCIFLAVIHVCLWLLWIVFTSTSSKRARILCFICNTWFVAASLLELYDFQPLLYYFDAHALWHAATVPLGFMWYFFWMIDVEHECSELVTGMKVK